jgi:hypothetical protein
MQCDVRKLDASYPLSRIVTPNEQKVSNSSTNVIFIVVVGVAAVVTDVVVLQMQKNQLSNHVGGVSVRTS